MKNFYILLIVILSSLDTKNGVQAVSLERKVNAVLPQLDQFVHSYLKKAKAPGGVIAIVGPHKVYFLKAYGFKKIGQKEPLTPSTVFQFASVSKAISATLAVKLYFQGKLSLEAPVNDYLPDFALKGALYPLRVKHLLSHTSGLSSQGGNTLIESCMVNKALYEQAQSKIVVAQPGERFDYHNIMYGLIEEILVSATNQTFSDLLHDNLFTPLGMHHITLGYQALTTLKDRAYPHHYNGKSKILSPCKKYSQCYYAVLASAGMNGSMLDLIPFLQAQLGGRPDVLSPVELSILHTPQIKTYDTLKMLQQRFPLVTDTGYALGWRWMNYAGVRVIYHGGWVNGFRPMIAFLPEYKVGIAILHHAETPFSFKTTMKFLDLFLGVNSQGKHLHSKRQ